MMDHTTSPRIRMNAISRPLDGYDWLYFQTLKVCRPFSRTPKDALATSAVLMTAIECWYVFGLALLSDVLLATHWLGGDSLQVKLRPLAVVLALGTFNAVYVLRRKDLATRFDAGQGRYHVLWLAFFLGSVLLLILGYGVALRAHKG